MYLFIFFSITKSYCVIITAYTQKYCSNKRTIPSLLFLGKTNKRESCIYYHTNENGIPPLF